MERCEDPAVRVAALREAQSAVDAGDPELRNSALGKYADLLGYTGEHRAIVMRALRLALERPRTAT
jgi:hypothetical protein